MSSDSNQENTQQDKNSGDKAKAENEDAAKADKKPLTFKDWKLLKESQSKPNEKSKNIKNNDKIKSIKQNINNNRGSSSNFKNNGFNGAGGSNCQGPMNFFAGGDRLPGFMLPNNFNRMNNNFNNGMNNFNNNGMNNFNNNGMNNFNNNGINNFNNNFGMRGNNFGCNNGFNNFNNFNRPNCYNNEFNNFNGGNNFSNTQNRFNGPSKDNLDLPDNFFASDGIYRQKDLMQKPLPNNNPFRNDDKAKQLLQEFDNSRYTKDDKKKKKTNKKVEAKKSNKEKQTESTNTIKLSNEPIVYIPNPKAKTSGKPYIPKPKVPEQNLEITKEEKKQQWKEYREAMKPFKNREFYNAKRVVQRLGKKAPSELEEKEIIRLANAREIMAAHKARLTAKYANYIKADDNSNELGELYLLKKTPLKYDDSGKTIPKQFQNYGNFGESGPSNDFESGRKIVGGYTGFKGFVSGGILEGTTQPCPP